jgi:hypothetical protein
MIYEIDSVVDSVVGGGRTDTVLGTHMDKPSLRCN